MKKHIIAAMAAFAVFGFTSVANAGWTTDALNKNVASQLTTATAGAAFNDFLATPASVYTTGGVVPLNSRITLTLSAGTFSAAPATLTGSAGTLTLLGNPVGTTTAVYVLTGAQIPNLGTITVPTGLKVNLTGLAVGATVDVSLDIKDGVLVNQASDSMAATFTPLFTVVTAVGSVIASATDTADVATGFTTFTTSGTTAGANFTDTLTANAAQLVAANDFVLLTLSGNFTGIGSVGVTGATSATSTGVDGTLAAVAGTTVPSFFSIDRAAGKAYARVTNATATAAGGGTTHTINVTADGTAIPAGTFTLAADVVAGGAVPTLSAHNIQAAATAYTVSRNGAVFTSDNISPSSVIRITDNGATTTVPGLISVSAWDAAGAPVTQVGATLPASVLGGHTVTIAKGVLKAAFPTAVRFNINVEAANASVTHFKSNAAGLNVTVGSVGNGTVPQL